MRPQSSRRPTKTYKLEIEHERPKSALIKYPYLSNSQSNQQPITFTMPNNPKLSKGMGQRIEKEQLYEDTVYLKKVINNLKKEYDDVLSQINEKKLEIEEKNKIIEECTKDDKIEFDEKDINESGNKSSLLALCKGKLNEMKKNYKKKCNENEELKQNIKITKIKEFKIQSEVIKSELDKLKNLYYNSKQIVENGNKEIDDLKEYKNKFNEQLKLINSMQNNYENLNKENTNLKEKIYEMENEISKNKQEQKELNLQNQKLKNTNEQYLNEKKEKANKKGNKNYFQEIASLRNEIGQYKTLCVQRDHEIQRLKDRENKLMLYKNDEYNPMIKPVKTQNFESLGKSNKHDNKLSLIKSLLHDAQIKIGIYENFFIKQGDNIKEILRNGGYPNNLSSPQSSSNNFRTNSNNNFGGTNTNNFEGTNNNFNEIEVRTHKFENTGQSEFPVTDNIQFIETNQQNFDGTKTDKINYTYSMTNDKLNEKNQNLISNDNPNLISEQFQDTNNFQKTNSEQFQNTNGNNETFNYNSFFHIIMKNLEANNLKKDIINKEVQEIINKFDPTSEITSDDFIKPFLDLLIKDMNVTQKDDIETLNSFLQNILEQNGNDTDKFLQLLTQIFESVFDYSTIDKNEMNKKLKKELQNYKILLNKFYEYDPSLTYIISYNSFQKIHQEVNLNLEDDLIEYLIYMMKSTLPEGHSIFDLSYQFVENLMQNDLVEDIINPEKIKDQEINYEDIQKQNALEISNKIKKFKENLDNNNLDIDNVLIGKIENIELDEGNVKKGIKKDDFIEILKNNGVNVNNYDEELIYNKYKLDDKFNDSQNLLDITLIQNSMTAE